MGLNTQLDIREEMREETGEENTKRPLLGADTVIRPWGWCHGCKCGVHPCPPEGSTGRAAGDTDTQKP